MKKTKHIFISYKSSEASFALRIAADLKNSGVKVWMDRLDVGIRPSQDWRLTIENALTSDKCNGLIAILSPAYLESKYCRDELARADRLGIQIYPIVLAPIVDEKWPLEIERLQYIDFQEWKEDLTYQNKFSDLLKVLTDKFPRQIVGLPDPETSYLINLLAELEDRQGVVNYVELEGETTKSNIRPAPRLEVEASYMVLLDHDASKLKVQKPINIRSISEAAEIYSRFVLIGSPGAGKTTVIRNMVLGLARRKLDKPRTVPLPMIVYLPQWQNDWSFGEFLKAKWPLNSNPLDLLEKGELFLYLDGLNEMGAEKVSKISELRSWVSKSSNSTQLIITCRADDYNEDLRMGNLPTVVIKPLSESKIKQFAKNYLGKKSKRFLDEILREKSNHDKRGLLQLATNPYFLTAFIIIYNTSPNIELPKNPGTLFKKLALALWKREELRSSLDIPFEIAEAELARLAFAMIDSDMPVDISLDYALLMLSNIEFLKVGGDANYLLIQNSSVRFYHQLIQEYFAAVGLEKAGISHIRLDKRPLQAASGFSKTYKPLYSREKNYELSEIPEYRRSSKWDQVIISLCGFTKKPEDIIRKIATVDPLLAADCQLSGIDIPLDNVIIDYIETASNESPTLRKAGLVALSKVGGEKAVPIIASALEDKDIDVRVLATSLLLQLGEASIPYFTNQLKTTSEDRVNLTMQALASLGPSAIPTLSSILRHETNIDIRLRACATLGRIKHKDSVSTLLSLLNDKENRLVKMSVESLGNIGDQSSVSELIGFLNKIPESDIGLRIAIVKFFGNTKSSDSVPILVSMITDESWQIHSAVMSSLKKIASPEALKPVKAFELLNARQIEKKNNAIQKIYKSYGLIGLVHGLESDSYWEIAKKLLGISENDFTTVVNAFNNGNIRARAMIAYCIGQRKDKRYESLLIQLLDDKSPFVRGVTIEALGKINSELAVPEITKSLYDTAHMYSNSKKRVCDNAAITLLKIGTEDTKKHLKKWAMTMINGRIAYEQTSPLTVLGKLGDNDSVPRLAKLLKSKKYWISKDAREALEKIGTEDALKAINKFEKRMKRKNA